MIVALIIGPYGLMSMGLWDYCTFEYIGPEHHTSSINAALALDKIRTGCMIWNIRRQLKTLGTTRGREIQRNKNIGNGITRKLRKRL